MDLEFGTRIHNWKAQIEEELELYCDEVMARYNLYVIMTDGEITDAFIELLRHRLGSQEEED